MDRQIESRIDTGRFCGFIRYYRIVLAFAILVLLRHLQCRDILLAIRSAGTRLCMIRPDVERLVPVPTTPGAGFGQQPVNSGFSRWLFVHGFEGLMGSFSLGDVGRIFRGCDGCRSEKWLNHHNLYKRRSGARQDITLHAFSLTEDTACLRRSAWTVRPYPLRIRNEPNRSHAFSLILSQEAFTKGLTLGGHSMRHPSLA